MPTFIRNTTVIGTQIDDDLVMMDSDQGRYFGLNPVARKIWELLEQPLTQEALVEKLVAVYDITPEQCSQDIAPFILQLTENKLISVADEKN